MMGEGEVINMEIGRYLPQFVLCKCVCVQTMEIGQ